MAPELAVARLKRLPAGSTVLDPMAGSGTVVRQALEFGHQAMGFDLDPLAVLMSRVWTMPVEDSVIEKLAAMVLGEAKALNPEVVGLPWIDDDSETTEFVKFWFGDQQRNDLRRLALILWHLDQPQVKGQERSATDVLRVALSRLIIVKENGASLARDVSHSRPHKVTQQSAFEVFPAFERSVKHVRKRLLEAPPRPGATVALGDARLMKDIASSEIDAVMTSPPYLNAIDYMRGHRLSLVWLGHKLSDLRQIRTSSVGAERAPDHKGAAYHFKEIADQIVCSNDIAPRNGSMVLRYAEDLYRIMSEIVRVLKSTGKAIFVIGNSCLQGIFIRNSAGVIKAASMVGLRLVHQMERELPHASRYLPMPRRSNEPLGKRMRTETVLTFRPV
jgi:hypothetical protein